MDSWVFLPSFPKMGNQVGNFLYARDKRNFNQDFWKKCGFIRHYFIRRGFPVRCENGHNRAGISSTVCQRTRLPCRVHTCHPPVSSSTSRTRTNKQMNPLPKKLWCLQDCCVRKYHLCMWPSQVTDGSPETQRDCIAALLKTTQHSISRDQTSF